MEQLINFIIRPPRAEYNPKHDLLDEEFMLKGKWFRRKDLEVKNSRGDTLQCSHYAPIVSPQEKPLPCVIYCHGNSGCRADASEAAIILLPSNITVFTLDFSGSGLSGGEHVTLGWNEKDDLRAVVEYLRSEGNVSLIGLMYGAEDPSIAGMVLDSPFSDLVDLMMELVDTYKVRLPKFTVKFAIQYMRKAIQKKAKFDITDLNTIKVAKSSFVPVLLGHAIDDDFILPHHSDRIYEAYVGDKNIIKFEGDHNSPRPQFYFDSINIFFLNVLQPPEDEVEGTFFDSTHDYFGRGSWSNFHGVSASASSTEDAIQQVRSKRPMSRMEVPADISSEDRQSEAQEGEPESNQIPSSSGMISFELSNGHPYGPHVPTTIDDDQYVEYPLDNIADFPSNVEEEERMFMEAVLESLKDFELRQSSGHAETSSTISNDPSKTTQEGDQRPSTAEHSKTVTPEVAQPTPVKETDDLDLSSEHHSPDSSDSRVDTLSSGTESSMITSVHTDSSMGTQSSSDTNIAANTKATVTVVRNPSNHIMDGLMRRWDFNFFRNNR
ncbi:hypothetical protein RJ641_021182 [Dillenia turbinata]|uniref:Serine aminopeptidase S33 domain-containing protein n=1 Tax=Dillenia turbinata TaxID=194707 RepID=A0AAN8YUR5_9MAGN